MPKLAVRTASQTVIVGDCQNELRQTKPDLIIADPPYNIGENYDVYKDNKPLQEYVSFCWGWLRQSYFALKDTGSLWLIIGDKVASEIDIQAKSIGFYQRSRIVWYFTFGQNSRKGFTPSHVNLFYYVKNPKQFTFNPDAIKVPSQRQLKYKDKRAKEGGKLPDDTWILSPEQIPDGFDPLGDTWVESRVCGTFKEKRGTPNQIPLPIVRRIIAACSNPGDLVVDPFLGSGTTLIAAKELGRNGVGIELSPAYAAIAKEAIAKAKPNPL